jgi:hypothetical protein
LYNSQLDDDDTNDNREEEEEEECQSASEYNIPQHVILHFLHSLP